MIELEDVKAWLKITVDTYDQVLTDLEERAVETIQRDLDWYFGPPRDAVEVLNGTGSDAMYLRQPPVGGEVTLETRYSVTGDWTAVPAENWELDGRGLFCSPGFRWQRGRRNFRASYQEGFEAAPGDIQQVVLELIGATWRTRGKEGLQSERIGDYAYVNAQMGAVRSTSAYAEARSNWRRGRM